MQRASISRAASSPPLDVLMVVVRPGAGPLGAAGLALCSRSALSAQRDAASFCSRICASVSEIGAEPRSTLR